MVRRENFLLILFFILLNSFLYASPQKELPLLPGIRDRLNLNGTWKVAVSKGNPLPSGMADWKEMDVPGLLYGEARGGSEYACFSRQVNVPAEWKDIRVFLLLSGARYNPQVYVNGKLIAGRLEGWTPFEVELTGLVEPGHSFRLDVVCQDWGATFSGNYVLPVDASGNWDILRSTPKNRIIAPIGGYFAHYGIWDDAFLVARPNAHLKDIFIQTSVRKNNLLTVTGISTHTGDLRVKGEVRDLGSLICSLGAVKITGSGSFVLEENIKSIQYWSPEECKTYSLDLSLVNGETGTVLDHLTEPFGFRELWAEGPDFYLNGVKRHLLASSTWPLPSNQSYEEVRNNLLALKKANVTAFRLHTQPWQRKWLDAADEVGVLIIEEGALWCDGGGGYAYGDERLWKNILEHLEGMVKRDRNHPSLVMWSLENEILHCGASQYLPSVEQRLAEMGGKIKALDPSHLITYEADLDPGGAADVIGLHYPHEIPDNYAYPNTADWLSGQAVTTGREGGLLGSRNKKFEWDRKKPLYIGEYLWVPFEDFSPASIFFGDEAYTDRRSFNLKAKAEAWRYQTIAYRRAGVSGMCPWTFAEAGLRIDESSPLYSVQKEVYSPAAVFVRELCNHYFASERMLKTFDVFNDGNTALNLDLHVTYPGWKEGFSKRLALEPAAHMAVKASIPMPVKQVTGELKLKIELISEGKILYSSYFPFHVWTRKRFAAPSGYKVYVYDPEERIYPHLQERNFQIIKDIGEFSSLDAARSIVVVGPLVFHDNKTGNGPVVIGETKNDVTPLLFFLDKGGRALFSAQDSVGSIFPGLELTDHASTITFVASAAHPVFKGLDNGDFRFWRDDHYVTQREIKRPRKSGARSLIVSGGPDALDQAPMVEMPYGKGRVILCQSLFGDKLTVEPVARTLLQNCLNYLGRPVKAGKKAFVLGSGNRMDSFVGRLDSYNLDFQKTASSLSDTNLLILHNGGEDMMAEKENIKTFINDSSGSHVLYWHSPDPAAFKELRGIMGLGGYIIEPSTGPLSFRETRYFPFYGFLREDLTFIGQGANRTWMREFEPDPAVIDRSLSFDAENITMNRFEVEEWDFSGKYVSVSADGKGVNFNTNGTAESSLTFASAGLYKIVLLAAGTPMRKQWPLVNISLDGSVVCRIMLDQSALKGYSAVFETKAGTYRITLSFINDAYDTGGEDRNLFLDALLVTKKTLDTGGVEFFCNPPAVAALKLANGNSVVIDCVRWDISQSNRIKADRYANTLFSSLGAPFRNEVKRITWISHKKFRPVGTIPYYKSDEKEISLVAAGTVSSVFSSVSDAEYEINLSGRSSPALGEYAKVRILLDEVDLGEREIPFLMTDTVVFGICRIGKGSHSLKIQFINDLMAGNEDRNFYFSGIGFKKMDS
ncbi:MAG: hypothetical protein JW969_19850 [Spirochaetales bacterium]|nr:hypothetical protein [Spirochaetales bacterium]